MHRHNVRRLAGRAVAVASYPGAGAAFLGNILLELGLDYVDPYTEILDEDGTARPSDARANYRRRMAASAGRDDQGSTPAGHLRFVKTHLLPDDFPQPLGVALLVRDPRDTLWSYYRWRRAFSEEGETRDFRKFLGSVEPLGRRPVDDWVRFHRLWSCAVSDHFPTVVLSFERLKTDGLPEIRELLLGFGLERDDAEIVRALEASSFIEMRRHEDLHADDGRRIMRRGEPGEWREWMTSDLADYFKDPAFRALSFSLGHFV